MCIRDRARTKKIDRIVALDEYDMETAATLREHLRVPGMGLTLSLIHISVSYTHLDVYKRQHPNRLGDISALANR